MRCPHIFKKSPFSGQNVDSMIFKEVMHELARKLGHLGKDFTDT
jgi:hypothetical protein